MTGFEDWRRAVNQHIQQRVGLAVAGIDLVASDYQTAWLAKLSPEAAATRLLEETGWLSNR